MRFSIDQNYGNFYIQEKFSRLIKLSTIQQILLASANIIPINISTKYIATVLTETTSLLVHVIKFQQLNHKKKEANFFGNGR